MSTVNVQHTPLGAFASFTLGFPGQHGGLGLGLGGPAGQPVYVAVEEEPGGGAYAALPFFTAADVDDAARFLLDAEQTRTPHGTRLRATAYRRDVDVVRDRWRTDELTFTVHSPLGHLPDPALPGAEATLRHLTRPAVLAELTVDNTGGAVPRRAFVGYAATDPTRAMRHIDRDGLVGVGEGGRTAIVTDAPGARSAIGFDPGFMLANADEEDPAHENWAFGLGDLGLLVLDAPPGQRCTFRFAICFYEAGPVTTGVVGRYLYTRWYRDITEVAAAALDDFDASVARWRDAADALGIDELPADRAFMLAHAVRSYYGSTQLLLDPDDRPLWVVNEGEYRMINTLDLTVDHAAFEARLHPWTLRDTLQRYLDRYSYRDRYGLSFTHDMGVANAFAAPGRSAYERTGRADCFSFMTAEQLANWVLCAGVYATRTADLPWCAAHSDTLAACLDSMVARDPGRSGGVGVDSDRVGSGREITTYDSLDPSLGQARGSTYLAVKYVAAYRWLARVFDALGQPDRAAVASAQAARGTGTILAAVRPDGTIPALVDGDGSAVAIPVVEGLALAYATGDTLAGDTALRAALRTHLLAVLRPGRCLFPDGGWRLTTANDNSWLSKVYLAQFVARHLLGLPDDEAMARADRAHVGWLHHPTEARWAWSDQIVRGVPRGSRYYPRGVTAVLWLDEKPGSEPIG